MAHAGIEAVIDSAIDVALAPWPLRIVTGHPRAGPFQNLAGEFGRQSDAGERADREGLTEQRAVLLAPGRGNDPFDGAVKRPFAVSRQPR